MPRNFGGDLGVRQGVEPAPLDGGIKMLDAGAPRGESGFLCSTGCRFLSQHAVMLRRFTFGRGARVNLLLGAGHFLSHFYQLCLPPLFIVWQQAFGVSYAELGLAMALMSGTTAMVQAPIGFLVDRYGARRFLIGGTLLMTMSIATMGLATAYWQ